MRSRTPSTCRSATSGASPGTTVGTCWRANLQYLYVAIPPMLLIVALGLLGWDANDVLGIVQLHGPACLLGWWGVLRRPQGRVSRPRRWLFALNYASWGSSSSPWS